jgi:hypothetical protein
MHHGFPPSSLIGQGVLQPPDSGPLPTFAADMPPAEPICVARKIKGKKRPNVFLDNCRFSNQSHEYGIILHNVRGGPILCKLKHPAPPIDDIDPHFRSHYGKAHHGNKLQGKLKSISP